MNLNVLKAEKLAQYTALKEKTLQILLHSKPAIDLGQNYCRSTTPF